MKKILAIAVATAISAPAMADMTIGGSIEMRYRGVDAVTPAIDASAASHANGGVAVGLVNQTEGKDSGFGIDNAALNISASETLDNGLTVAAKFDVDNLYRGATASGNDASLTVSGDFGALSLSVIDSGNGIIGLGAAGAPAETLDGTVIVNGGNVSLVKYTLPAMGIATVSVNHSDTTKVGAGMAKASTGVAVSIAAGGLTAAADYTAEHDGDFGRTRVSGKYDAGVVVVGAGMENFDYKEGKGTDYVETIFGISAPVGDIVVGGTIMAHDEAGTASDRKGYSVGASYVIGGGLSSSIKYASWKDESQRADSQNMTTVSLKYAF